MILTCADECAGAQCFYDIEFLHEYVMSAHSLRHDEQTGGHSGGQALGHIADHNDHEALDEH
jgi:hypothetical protein